MPKKFFLITFLIWIHASNTSATPILPDNTYLNIHLGIQQTSSGKSQTIELKNLPNAFYSVTGNLGWNGLFGIGLLANVQDMHSIPLSVGLSGFYLFNQTLGGKVSETSLSNTLAYSYSMTNLPMYLTGKTLFPIYRSAKKLAIDIGFGPNIMTLYNYQEANILQDSPKNNAYRNRTDVAFSTTIGLALNFANTFGNAPLECGYRFMYLGGSKLTINNSQFTTPLKTGTTFANILSCTSIV